MATIYEGKQPDTESQAAGRKTTEGMWCEDKVFMFLRLYFMNEPSYWVWQCNERQYSQNPALSVTTGTKGWVQSTLATTPYAGSCGVQNSFYCLTSEQLLIAAQCLSSGQFWIPLTINHCDGAVFNHFTRHVCRMHLDGHQVSLVGNKGHDIK